VLDVMRDHSGSSPLPTHYSRAHRRSYAGNSGLSGWLLCSAWYFYYYY